MFFSIAVELAPMTNRVNRDHALKYRSVDVSFSIYKIELRSLPTFLRVINATYKK